MSDQAQPQGQTPQASGQDPQPAAQVPQGAQPQTQQTGAQPTPPAQDTAQVGQPSGAQPAGQQPAGQQPQAGQPPMDPNMMPPPGYPPMGYGQPGMYPPPGYGYPPQGMPPMGYGQPGMYTPQGYPQQGMPVGGMQGAGAQGATEPEDTTPANFKLGSKLPRELKVKCPPSALKFDEDKFLKLLAGSISLSKDEKKKIVESVPKLKIEQIEELMRIFEEEKEKFAALSKKHVPQLEKLAEQHYQEWMQLESEFEGEQKKQVDKQKAEEIRKNLGI